MLPSCRPKQCRDLELTLRNTLIKIQVILTWFFFYRVTGSSVNVLFLFFYSLVCHAFVLVFLFSGLPCFCHVSHVCFTCVWNPRQNVLTRLLKREKRSLTLDGSVQLYDTAHVLHIRLFGWQHIYVLVVRRCISQCSASVVGLLLGFNLHAFIYWQIGVLTELAPLSTAGLLGQSFICINLTSRSIRSFLALNESCTYHLLTK